MEKKTALLRLTMTEKYGKTRAEDYYFTAPYKIGFPETEGSGQKVILMMASAGLLKGDMAECQIMCKAHTKTELTDQSFTKVFDTGDGYAGRKTKIIVEEQAVLDYHPSPVIPFANSTFDGCTQIDLKETSVLYFSEIMAGGRIAMGEKFAFRKFENRIQINVEGRPVYLERNRLIPQKQHLEDFFYFDKFSHQGTFYYYGPQIASIDTLKEKTDRVVNQYLEAANKAKEEILYGITEVRKGVVWKILANQAQDIEEMVKKIKLSLSGAFFCDDHLVKEQENML